MSSEESKKRARLMLLEFMTILLVLPLPTVNLLVGGPAGFALICQLYDALTGDGRPGQNSKNGSNLN